jgi:hypothetical protein
MTTIWPAMMPTIEDLWRELKASPGGTRQRRVDPSHAIDLYADFDPPDRPGMVAVCRSPLHGIRPLRAISIDQGQRADGRWSLRIGLQEPQLLNVFTALCRDIISFTRSGVSEADLGSAVFSRIERWRILLERDNSGLDDSVLRGLVGELFVLEVYVLPGLPVRKAVAAWTGPDGSPQDFLLPGGTHLEVKTIAPSEEQVHINGLAQLDPGPDPLLLLIVRAAATGIDAPGGLSAALLVTRLRRRLMEDADALAAFDGKLSSLGWHDHPRHHELALRPVLIEEHHVDSNFPKLTATSVPAHIVEADYSVLLPHPQRVAWRAEP